MLTKHELDLRKEEFFEKINVWNPDWDIAVIVDKVNQYYFTGTMQNGVLILLPEGDIHLFVKKSYERAKIETPIENIHPMDTYRDMVKTIGQGFENGYFELEIIPYKMLARINKHIKVENILPLDNIIQNQRSVKTKYELSKIRESGHKHAILFNDIIPGILKEGMSEVDLAMGCFDEMMKLGHHGVTRFSMFQQYELIGQVAFGAHSLYPTSFNGPGGSRGISNAVPVLGDPKRKLKKGDLIFADVGFGIDGYHTDKTQVYMYKDKVPADIASIHRKCMDIQDAAAKMLIPGNIPSDIYKTILNGLDQEFKENFMGFGESVPFLGHGVGLYINDMPVIANKFDDALEKNMVIALEPKKGIEDFGMVGVEETFIVTEDGGVCVTGGRREIIEVF